LTNELKKSKTQRFVKEEIFGSDDEDNLDDIDLIEPAKLRKMTEEVEGRKRKMSVGSSNSSTSNRELDVTGER
jgi:hypothetical protein